MERVISFLFVMGWVVAAFGLWVGWEATTQPQRGIKRYQSIMRRLNWQVAPIDSALELRSTRRFGILLILLSLALATLLFRWG